MYESIFKGVIILRIGAIPEEHGDLQTEVLWVCNKKIKKDCCLRHYNSRAFVFQTPYLYISRN